MSEDEIGVLGGGYLGEPNNFEYECKSLAEYQELIRAIDAIGSTVGRSDAGFIRLVGFGLEGGSLGVGGENAVNNASHQWQAAYREMQSLVDALSDAVESEDDSRLESAFDAASAEAQMMFWTNAVTVTKGLKPDSPEAIREQVDHLMNGGQATLKELLADIESMSVEGQEHALFLLTHHPAAEVRQIGAVIGEIVDASGVSSPATKAEPTPTGSPAYADLPSPSTLAMGRAPTSAPQPVGGSDGVVDDTHPTPSPRELAALKKNLLGAVDTDSRLVELGHMANGHLGSEAARFSIEEKGAVAFISMLDIYFSYVQDRELYRTVLDRVNVFVDRESKRGGRAWWLVRDHLLEIGRQRGWSSLDTLSNDSAAEQGKQFNNLTAQEVGTTRDPGYYLDPQDPARERWWDGRKWVGLTRPAKPGATTLPVRDVPPAEQAVGSPSAAVPASRKPATSGLPQANRGGGVPNEGSKSYQKPDDSSVEHTGRADPHVPGYVASPQAGRQVMSGPMGRSSRRRWVAIGVVVALLVAGVSGVIAVRRNMALNDLKDVYQDYSAASGEGSRFKLCAKPVGGEFDYASVSSAPCFSPPGSRAVNDNRTRLVLADGTGVITWEVKGDRFFRTSDGKAFVVYSRNGEKYLKPM